MNLIDATTTLKQVMGRYFSNLHTGDKQVAWCTSVGPAELLRAFGFEVYFPENHGALLGATRTAMDTIPEATKVGFSGHVCSYTTADIGAFLADKSPLKAHYGMDGPPQPDIIVYNTNQCREVQDWFSFYARHYGCPLVGIHPPRHLDHVDDFVLDLVVHQFRELAEICTNVVGHKLDEAFFCETVRLSKEATHLWQACLKTSVCATPPFSFFDGVIHMGPIVVLRGTQEALEYYKALFAELSLKATLGQGFLPQTQSRIFWDGMPVWGRLRMLSDLFADNQSAVLASTYCNSWIFDAFDENDPWVSTAKAYTEIFINRNDEAKARMLTNWFREYYINGVIYHDAKTCFHNSNSRFGLPQYIRALTGIPFLIVEGDLCDLRFFSDGQTMTRIETFLEQLETTQFLVP